MFTKRTNIYVKNILLFSLCGKTGVLCPRCYGEMVWSFAPVEGLYLCWVNKKAEAVTSAFVLMCVYYLPHYVEELWIGLIPFLLVWSSAIPD